MALREPTSALAPCLSDYLKQVLLPSRHSLGRQRLGEMLRASSLLSTCGRMASSSTASRTFASSSKRAALPESCAYHVLIIDAPD